MPSEETRGPKPRSLLFEHPAFGLFWCARGFSALSYQMQAVAAGWQLYALTHSTFQLGMLGLVQFLPMAFLTLPAGHVADRYDRRLVIAVSAGIQGAAMAVLAAGSWGHWLSPAGIFAAIGMIGAARAFERPAGQAIMPTLVPEPLVPKAIAWGSSGFQVASIVGPAAGGLLYGLGAGVSYGAAALMEFASVGFMLALRRKRNPRQGASATLSSVFTGVHFIRRNPVILGSISLDLFAVLLGGATALLPAFARDILGIGAWGLGALRSAPAIGALAMSAILARRPLGRRVGRKMFAAVLVFGLATVVFGLSRSPALSFAALFVLGAADIVSVVIRSSVVQLGTPNEMRGRVSAVNSLFIGTSNQLGEFESGITASWFGTVMATVAGGVGTLVVCLLWMRLFPELMEVDRLGIPGDAAGTKAPGAS
jgi:MFS family permease